jgi:WhiB family redox-sensing transcriptional regulator
MACPVRAQCLDYALETHQLFGIWGGLSERQRRHLMRQQGRRAA